MISKRLGNTDQMHDRRQHDQDMENIVGVTQQVEPALLYVPVVVVVVLVGGEKAKARHGRGRSSRRRRRRLRVPGRIDKRAEDEQAAFEEVVRQAGCPPHVTGA